MGLGIPEKNQKRLRIPANEYRNIDQSDDNLILSLYRNIDHGDDHFDQGIMMIIILERVLVVLLQSYDICSKSSLTAEGMVVVMEGWQL